ncbi:hypothetical protein [Streptomyces mirabilis]
MQSTSTASGGCGSSRAILRSAYAPMHTRARFVSDGVRTLAAHHP